MEKEVFVKRAQIPKVLQKRGVVIMYGKIFSSLFEGTMIGKSDMQHVFMYMLAVADKDGYVDKQPSLIAFQIGIPLERVTAAIKDLSAPDMQSRSREEEGRRIVLSAPGERDWGWHIVNKGKYDSIRDAESRRETFRKASQKKRDAKKAANVDRQHSSTLRQHVSTESTHIDVAVNKDVNKDVKKERKRIKKADHSEFFTDSQAASSKFKDAWLMWLDHRKDKRNKISANTAKLQLKKLAKSATITDQIAILHYSIEQGYTGLFAESKTNRKSKQGGSYSQTEPAITAFDDPSQHASFLQ